MKNRFFGICFEKNEINKKNKNKNINNNNEEEEIMIVMEYCDKGDLSQLFESNEQLNWETRMKIIVQIGYGMSKLHQRNIIHRDIKSKNILVKSVGKTSSGKEEDFEIKIADLGYAKMKTSLNSFSVDGNIVGTVAWTSPGINKSKFIIIKCNFSDMKIQ